MANKQIVDVIWLWEMYILVICFSCAVLPHVLPSDCTRSVLMLNRSVYRRKDSVFAAGTGER